MSDPAFEQLAAKVGKLAEDLVGAAGLLADLAAARGETEIAEAAAALARGLAPAAEEAEENPFMARHRRFAAACLARGRARGLASTE